MGNKLTIAIMLLAACGQSGDDGGGGGGGDTSHPAWLTAGWDHDEGRSGFADYADYAIDFDAGGDYVWQYAVDVLDGSWDFSGGALHMDGTTADFHAGKSCRVMTLDGKTYLSRGAQATDCPTKATPLSALEQCLVGKFSAGTPNGGTQYYEFAADRTMTEFYDDPGYTSGGDEYTRFGEFAMNASGDITMEQPGSSPEVRADAAGLLGMTREGAIAPGCDKTGFQKFGGGGGGNCSLSCSSDRVCSEYQGNETCCPSAFPFYCPDLDVCFSSASQRDSQCATAYYGDPAFGCEGGQTQTSISGITGDYCAPSCAGTGSFCPASFNGAQGTCSIRGGGSSTPNLCALACTDPGVTGGTCPNGMTCSTSSSGNHWCVFQ